MYVSHFGLTEPPFSITPDPRYVYMSEHHREALAHLLYGVSQTGGFVQLTGDVGTGKTTLCRCLLEQLPPEVDVALILNPRLTSEELLAAVCDELRIPYPSSAPTVKALVDALYQYLLGAHARGRRTVLIIDEAQGLSAPVLEQVRLLTNLETAKEKLLQIVLIGQPELIELLDRPDLRQVAQRVTARYHLRAFALDGTRAYIAHRLHVAGAKTAVFSDSAMREVHRRSGGVPRLINVICDRALLGAYATERDRVDARMVRRAATEVGGSIRRALRRPLRWGIAAALAAVAVGLSIVTTPDLLAHFGGLRAPRTSMPTPVAKPPVPVTPPAADGAAGRSNGQPGSGMPSAIVAVATQPEPPRTNLSDLLASPSAKTDRRSAFVTLFSLWGVQYARDTPGLACDHARENGLECLSRNGSWAKLRRFNLPAVLELTTPNGARHYVAVTSLDERSATVDVGGRPTTVPLVEIDPLWEGSFLVLWKSPPFRATSIAPGQRGKHVAWLRQRLAEIDGAPLASVERDFYDATLAARVKAFQRGRRLVPDGIVGEETLALLMITSATGIPSLGPRDR
jgi:general secretion pathway protein A